MASMPLMGVTLLFNGVPYSNCDVEFSVDRNWSRPQTEYVLNVKTSAKNTDLFVPLVVNYENTRSYRIQLMEQQIKVLLQRLMYLFPLLAFSIKDCEYFDNPSVESESGTIITRYHHTEIILGQLTSLVWFSDQELHDQVQKKLAPYKQQEEEEAHKKWQEEDPLYSWKEKMSRIGYGFDWKLVVSQTHNPKDQIFIGDTLVYARCPGLHTLCPDILIGPLYVLKDYADETLQKRIETLYKDAMKRYGGTGIHYEKESSPS